MSHPHLIKTHEAPRYPAAWYTVAAARDLAVGALMPFRLCGIDLVLYRSEDGVFRAIEDRCPHMGGSFSAGGRVVHDAIECPVHRFRFSPEGVCTGTGYGTPPPSKACVRPWFTAEKNDVLMVWYHPAGEAPLWEVPTEDRTGWTPHTVCTFDIRAPVSVVAEGIADMGHLTTVHGYHDVAMLSDFHADQHRLSVSYGFSNARSILGQNALARLIGKLVNQRIRVSFDYVAHGLGYAHTELYIPAFEVRTRHLVNPVPIDERRTRLFVTMSIQHLTSPGKISPVFHFIPERWSRRMMFAFMWHGYLHDLRDDIIMWEHLVPLASPALSRGDGPVAKFRRWAGQFYA